MSENLGWWIGIIVGLAVFLWPKMYMLKMKRLTRSELAEISSEYDNVNSYYLAYALLWSFVVISPILLLSRVSWQFETEQIQIIMSVWSVVLFSSLGCAWGMIALKKGVHPASKFFGSRTWYVYDETDRVRQLGRLQVYSAVVAIAIAILVGLVCWGYVR